MERNKALKNQSQLADERWGIYLSPDAERQYEAVLFTGVNAMKLSYEDARRMALNSVLGISDENLPMTKSELTQR
jgi:hypothetical protein